MNNNRKLIIEKNEAEFPYTKWIDSQQLAEFEQHRNKLIQTFIQLGGKNAYHETKYFTKAISPGCKICGDGYWSCLFINNKCNANCFYCPASQNNIDTPTTNTLVFPKKKEYISYFQKSGFTGFSISGGEPLITFERSLEYLNEMNRKFGSNVHKWLYTNGILLTKEKVIQLQKAGLNELRFDLSAINYSLEPLKLAKDMFENITIEIPAIPEDSEKLKSLLSYFKEYGAHFLNLHQLRVTNYNFPKVKTRNYTFLHGPNVTVLESELTAFEIMNYNLESNTGLAINYCSYIYKKRFQNLSSRLRWASLWQDTVKEITKAGFIREMTVDASEEVKKILFQKDAKQWKENRTKIFFSQTLLEAISAINPIISVSYYEIRLTNQPTYHYSFQEVELSQNRSMYLEKRKVDSFSMKLSEFEEFLKKDSSEKGNNNQNISAYEFIEKKLMPYY